MKSDAGPEAGNILFLGKRFYTNKDAWTERFGRMFHLPAAWAQTGHDVLLWLVDYHTRTPIEETASRLRMVSTPVPGLRSLRTLLRALRHRPTIVVASGDAYIGFLGWTLARLSGAKFVLDVYDKYDEFAGYVKPLGLDLFGWLRRRSDMRLYASQGLAQAYASEQGGGCHHVAPNGVDAEVFRPMAMADCRRALGLDPASRLVGYFGGMEEDRGVNDLVRAVALLRATGMDIGLLVCGKQHASTPLDEDWILYRGMVPHAQMPQYMNASDVLVVPYRNSPFMDMGASCKIAEYLMCERPVVSTRTPNFVANFPLQAGELGAGLCDPGNPEGLADAIRSQLRDQVVVTVPSDMEWSRIADAALGAIHSGTER